MLTRLPWHWRQSSQATWSLRLGAKGLGDRTAASVAPAVANAVYHATGKRVRDLPITIEKLL
jgi:xanthine dehydrogenase YagR molybdenum-binding subunit